MNTFCLRNLIMLLAISLAAGFVSAPSRARADEFADRYRAYQQHIKAGRAALNKKDYRAAIDHYTKAIEASPFVASHYFDRGMAWEGIVIWRACSVG